MAGSVAVARPVAVLTLAWAVSALGLSLLRRLWSRRAFDGLDNVVSFSARLIAASRANESAREDAYVRDPLAAVLAGKVAMAKVAERMKARSQQQLQDKQQQPQQHDSSQGSGSDQPHALIQPKQLSSDNMVKVTADQPPAPVSGVKGDSLLQRPIGRIVFRTLFFDDAVLTATGAYQWPSRKEAPPMFTAFREALGGGNCKQVVLLGSGMDSRPWRLELPEGVSWFEVDRADVLAAKTRLLKQAGAAVSSTNQRGTKYPLRCASWETVSLDLEEAGWSNQLLTAGFAPCQPTVWILEGLLYYLQPDVVPHLLQEAASVSGEGSALIASICDADFIEELKQRETYRNPENIMSGWKWGCPGEPGQYFGDNGWKVLSNPTWLEACAVYGLNPEQPDKRAGLKADASSVSLASATGSPQPGTARSGQRSSSIRYVTAILPA